MSTYIGFSTVNINSQKKFTLIGNELIKQDLLNAFNTRRGSRVMQPQIGCIAWELLFEPMTASELEDLQDNLTGIINADPRVKLQNINITSADNTITASLSLFFILTNTVESMIVVFDNAASSSLNF